MHTLHGVEQHLERGTLNAEATNPSNSQIPDFKITFDCYANRYAEGMSCIFLSFVTVRETAL